MMMMMMMMMISSPAVRGAGSQQRHPMTGGRRADPGVSQPQHGASGRGSAEQQFNPHRNRILGEPSVSRTLSRHERWPVPSLQDVINGLPSRNVGGKGGAVQTEGF
jgi:hypothetical protein